MIEPPFAFFQEQIEVLFRHAVVTPQVPFSLVPKILNSVDVAFLFDECLRMINANMSELRDIQNVVGAEAVGIDDAVRLNAVSYNSQQCLRLSILNHDCVNPATALEETKDRHLSGGPSPSFALSNAAKIALINLNLPSKERGLGSHLLGDHFSKFMKIERCRMPVHIDQFGRRSSRCARYKLLNQLYLNTWEESTFSPFDNHLT